MAGAPDSAYITGDLPDEMRSGVQVGVDVAAPTGIVDVDGVPAQLTRIRLERPAHIPAGPPRISLPEQPAPNSFQHSSQPANFLVYDFPLLPGVQCRVELRGEPSAAHLEQLVEYLTVACRKLREQEESCRNQSSAPSAARKSPRTKGTVQDQPKDSSVSTD